MARVAYHCFLDGRDMAPRSALDLLPKVRAPIATVHGRFWAMDRDKRWDRTERSWRAIVDADGPHVSTPDQAVRACYARAECRDELLEPHVVGDGVRVEDGDAVIFLNFRPDRARQLTLAFMQDGFDGFAIERRPRLSCYVTMTDYKLELPDVRIAFPKQEMTPLAEILSARGLRQLHCAETEKYAHVTYFFNGGREEPFDGEDRVLVPSPKVTTYDLRPEMSAEEVARLVAAAIRAETYDFVVVNFANPDMVGHTGDLPATLRAMEVTDAAVGAVVGAALEVGGCVLITGDHGNAEELRFPDGGVNTQHSTNPVPVVLVGEGAERRALRAGGLRDIAPTILDLMGLPAGERMTGKTLLRRVTADPARQRGVALVWATFAVVAGAMALLALLEWSEALASGRAILYGEGPVAHAAALMRSGAAYRDATGAVAANYPPLYLLVASLGDPFRAGRAVTIASAITVALIVGWRARGGGALAATALGLGWIALAPVAIWGAAIKPDLFAVALTLGGVAALDRSRGGGRAAYVAGALLALAVWAKPTALLPAAAVLAWAAVTDRAVFARAAAGFLAIGGVAALHAAALGPADVWRHVVAWNVLPWSAEQTALVLVLGVATLGIVLAVAALSGALRGLALAYLLGALAVVLLAGREGATINYLLDLAAAIGYALATVAARVRRAAALPIGGMVQLAVAVALLTPFGIVPGRAPTTGAWGQPERGEVIHALGPGPHLVEDSGLLIADGREPVIDDLFLWSRLARTGAIDPAAVIADARRGAFATVVSEADLAALDRAPAYERARWHPDLVAAILERYVLDRSTGVLWVYRPR